MAKSLKLFNVTPASGARTVPVLATSMESAIDTARFDFQHNAKLRAQRDPDVKVGKTIARAVHSNRGIEAAYRAELRDMIRDMHNSVEYWLTAAYRNHPPRLAAMVDLAQDAAPSGRIKRILDDLAKRWIDRFNESAPKIADAYMRAQFKATDASFKAALKDAGWTVQFKMTPAIRDAFEASLQENVGLIRSIPEQYLQQVQGVVMRTYAAGRDLQEMTKGIKALYPQVGDRAELIARDQSNKSSAVVARARALQLGIKQAIWMHSSAGKTPRPSHLKAGRDKLRYDIAKGAYLDGKWIQPGELINCRCTARVVLPI